MSKPSIKVVELPLQEVRAEALAYGAKDTGEMGGGAAASILAATGAAILPALRSELALSSRRIGDAVITDSFALHPRGVGWIVHVLSIIRDTPEGAWCPEPENLSEGVTKALRLASGKGAQSIAFSMLGTGEGRVKPEDAARIMLRGIRAFEGAMEVTLALPTRRDLDAMRKRLALEG